MVQPSAKPGHEIIRRHAARSRRKIKNASARRDNEHRAKSEALGHVTQTDQSPEQERQVPMRSRPNPTNAMQPHKNIQRENDDERQQHVCLGQTGVGNEVHGRRLQQRSENGHAWTEPAEGQQESSPPRRPNQRERRATARPFRKIRRTFWPRRRRDNEATVASPEKSGRRSSEISQS